MTGLQPAQPSPDGSALRRVQLLIDAGRPHDAMDVAREALREAPDDPDLVGAMAWALLAAGDAHAARTWAERSLALDPANGWVHDLRARALLKGAGSAEEAREAAEQAVWEDPHDPFSLYTLVRASLQCNDRTGAAHAAATLRRTAPGWHLGPLAEALIELERGRVDLDREPIPFLALVALGIFTGGTGLVVLGILWAIRALRRAPYLRRADALLHEVLRLEPENAAVRALASDVLRLRFRFARAVDYEVAAAAADPELVDAKEFTASIARRTTGVVVAGWVTWIFVIGFADELVASRQLVAGGGLLLAVAVTTAIFLFDRGQTLRLPQTLVRRTRRCWFQPVATALAAATIVFVGSKYSGGQHHHLPEDYYLAGVVSSPVAVGCAAVFAARFLRARREG